MEAVKLQIKLAQRLRDLKLVEPESGFGNRAVVLQHMMKTIVT